MKRKLVLYHLLATICFFCSASLFAQKNPLTAVTGKVTDQANGQPLLGATVSVKGANQSVAVDATGNFSITVPANATLVVSYVGYGTQEIPVKQQRTVNVTMSNTSSTLNDVVVIGYGQVRKRDLTGSVVSIKGSEVTKVPVTTPLEALQGKIPGADIYRDNGYAGGGVNIRIRGNRSNNSTSSGANAPLIIIDGVQGVTLNDVNPNDIETIDVLKDGSSTAIYGSRGANGVIIVTTKKGTSGKPKITFNTYAGATEVSKYGPIKSGPEYIAFKREAYRAAGTWNGTADDPKIFNQQELYAIANQQYIDWASLLLHHGAQQEYQVGVTGGGEKTKVYFSGSYFHEKGVLKMDDFKRYSARFNIQQDINKWMKAGINTQYAFIDNNIRRDPFNFGWKAIPLGLPYDSLGNVNLYPVGGTQLSPLIDEQPGQWKDNAKTNRFSGAVYLELTPVKNLSLRSTINGTLANVTTGIYYGKNTINGGGANSQSQIINTQNNFISWENLLTYRRDFGNHALTVTGVTTYNQTVATSATATGRNQVFPSQYYYNLTAANQNVSIASGYSRNNLLSYTGRINYSYLGKYILQLTAREDGSSKLGPGHKWYLFPSAAFAWRVSDESFMKNVSLVNDLKLRLSYGISGNDVINAYGSQGGISAVQFSYTDATAANAYTINTLFANPALQWEVAATTDLGIDFSILKNRLSGAVDLYDATTRNVIFNYALPSSTGYQTVNRNLGETNNKGIEVSLTSNNIVTKSFKWTTTLSYARNKERITKLPNGNVYSSDYRNSLIIGEATTILYDYVKLGLWQLGDEREATQYNSKPGDIKIADLNNDGKITPDDRTVIGARVPKWTGGLNNDFSFKNFDLNVLFIGRFGQWMTSDYYAKYYKDGSQNGARQDYWTPENPTNKYPRPVAGQAQSYITTLTEYENSYIKLRNITLGYTLPKALTDKYKLGGLRIYVTGKNLTFFSKDNKDFDPESEGIVDQPVNKMIVGGLNLTF